MTVNSEPEQKAAHFTKITLKNHIRQNDKKIYRNQILPHILETFSCFKKGIKIKMFFDHELLYPDNKNIYLGKPKILKSPEVDNKGKPKNNNKITWERKLDFEHDGKQVKGFVMIRETGSYNQPGIRLMRNKRVIDGE